SASTRRWQWLPCTEACTTFIPNRSAPLYSAVVSTVTERRLRRFHTCGAMRTVTCTGIRRSNPWRFRCATFPFRARGRPRRLPLGGAQAAPEAPGARTGARPAIPPPSRPPGELLPRHPLDVRDELRKRPVEQMPVPVDLAHDRARQCARVPGEVANRHLVVI